MLAITSYIVQVCVSWVVFIYAIVILIAIYVPLFVISIGRELRLMGKIIIILTPST